MEKINEFFASLFDLSFSEFITTKLIKFIYIIQIVSAALFCLISIIAAFANGIGAGLGTLVIAPIMFLFFIVFSRLWLELIIVIFRIAEHTQSIAEHKTTSSKIAA